MLQVRVAAGAPRTPGPHPAARVVDERPPAPVAERFVVLTPDGSAPARLWEMVETDDPPAVAGSDGYVAFRDERGEVRTLRRVAGSYADPVTVAPGPAPPSVGRSSTSPRDGGVQDVVAIGPASVVRVVGRFGPVAGRYRYRCLGADLADLGLVRPFAVLPAGIAALAPH